MKKSLALLLCVLILICSFGCDAQKDPTPPAANLPEKDFSAYAGIVADPQTWYNELMALPIANDSMTEEELRQLCVDAMRFNLTFPWTPSENISYFFTLLERNTDVSLASRIAYSGLLYYNNYGKGNVWKALEHYDKETGTIDVAAFGNDFYNALSSACARGVEWGWSRVSNSHGLESMLHYNQYGSNIALVGSYNYSPGISFAHGDGTLQIIKENGVTVMLESYAAMKMADGLYSSSSYHVFMCADAPVVVRDKDGNINPLQSYVLILEQDTVGTTSDQKNYTQSNGVTMRPLGTVDKKYTFMDLMDKGYIPFTIKELIGEDPIEPGEAWLGSTRLENGADITVDELLNEMVYTNYGICTINIEVHNPEGQVLLDHKCDLDTTPLTFNKLLTRGDFAEQAAPYADGSNTVHVYVRLSTGELKEAFNTVLKIS